jgi:hypothetical protein
MGARDDDPDVEIGASARARSLRFVRKPRTNVELHGEVTERGRRSSLRTESGSERENLPDEVEPGVVYRDVDVHWRAVAWLDERGSAGGRGKGARRRR